jgi:pimeloyl-ACP methyl ester carboxylesterase
VPYLIVSGSALEEPYREWLAAELPHAEVVVLGDGGHFPHLAHPAEFARFLADTSGWSRRVTV